VLENRFPSLLSKQSSKQKKRITHSKSHLLFRVVTHDPAPDQMIVGKKPCLLEKSLETMIFPKK